MTNAEGLGQWARTVARTAVGTTDKSPFVQVTKAKKVRIELDRKVAYELDGGDREPGQGVEGQGRAGRDHRPGAAAHDVEPQTSRPYGVQRR